MLRELSLWDKRKAKIMELSGGMKRRVMIAKALTHEPDILFLDEPTAGVDVELRRDMWNLVRQLRESGVTIILTTHYIEEAEEMADRVGVISKGELILVEEKTSLMKKLGKKELTLNLTEVMDVIPARARRLEPRRSRPTATNCSTCSTPMPSGPACPRCSRRMSDAGIGFKDLHTRQSSLEDIFVSLVHEERGGMSFNLYGTWAIYRFEMARALADALAEPGDAGHHHLALFHRVRRGDRLADDRDRRRPLWRVHRAGADHAVPVHPEHLQRQLRHLLPASSPARSTNCSRRRSRRSRR